MINLLKETLDVMKENGKTPEDVVFVQIPQCNWREKPIQQGSWADFAAIANFSYDNGFGGNKINLCLRIVGVDWWLERHEYDGSEWWEFKTRPQPLAEFALLADLREA